jgi:RND family efflux transporter MFP subunit
MNLTQPVKLSRAAAVLLALAFITAGVVVGYLLQGQDAAPSVPAGDATAVAVPMKPSAPPETEPAGEAVVTIAPEIAQRAGIVVERASEAKTSAALRVPGTVEPNAYRQVVVTPIAGGRVTRVLVELGDRVRRGQPLASVYSPELADAQSRLIALRAELGASAQEVNRTRRLVEIGAASRQELERIEAAHAGRVAAADGARSRLVLLGMPEPAIERLAAGSRVAAIIDVPAPLDGVVTERMANTGLNVDPSTPLFTVVNLAGVWVVGDLFERDLPQVDVGSQAIVTVAAVPGRTYEGKVTYIDPQVNPATRTARMRVEIDNTDRRLRLGMLAEVSISTGGGAAVVLVPRDAVQTVGDRHLVYVPAPDVPGRYLERTVQVGNRRDARIEIREGLDPGESIVTGGSFYLRAERERLGTQVERAAPARVRVLVDSQGFQPSRVHLPAGQRTEITFVRTSEQTCATEVVFPQLEIRRPLPLDTPVVVQVPPQASGVLSFICGMDMIRGVAAFSSSGEVSSGSVYDALLQVTERELFQRLAGEADRRGLLEGSLHGPLVDLHPLDHPERRHAIRAAAVNEDRLVLRFVHRGDEPIDQIGIGRRRPERKVKVSDARLVGGGLRFRDACSLLLGQPQVDDGDEPRLLQFGHRLRRGRSAAGDRRLDAAEVADAGKVLLANVLWRGRQRHGADQRERDSDASHGVSPV